MDAYHNIKFIDHIAQWPKVERTFSEGDILTFKEYTFYEELEKIYRIKIINEDIIRTKEIYWRLVGPNYENNVGPLHADSQFWILHNGSIEKNNRRLKIWISIHNQMNKNGFRLIENSQKNIFIQGEEKRWKNEAYARNCT